MTQTGSSAAQEPIDEARLQAAVIDTARVLGWTVAHFRPARTKHGWATPVAADGKGFPDLVLAHPNGRLIFAELKSLGGRVTAEQGRWLELLGRAAAKTDQVDVFVWTPLDWPMQITETLSGRQVIVVS